MGALIVARRKAPAQIAPKTLEEAIALLARYSAIAAGIAQVEHERDVAIAEITAVTDARIAPFESELKDLFRQLKPWWAVVADDMTDNKRKSIELGGCVIGTRTSTPKLVYLGTEPAAIGRLKMGGAEALIRTKETLDKEHLLKLLKEPAGYAIAFMGFAASQKEEFFIDRLPPKPPAVELVADEEAVA